MGSQRKAPTTDYYALWNIDWQSGGIYYNLSDCAISVLVKLQANCSGDGWLMRKDGKGCSNIELQHITNIPYKRLRVAIIELQKNHIITRNTEGAIKIISFMHDNTRRKHNRDNRTLMEANGKPLENINIQ